MTVTHLSGECARSCLTSSFECECCCSVPLTPLTTGRSICWQMCACRDSDMEGMQYSPYFLSMDSYVPYKPNVTWLWKWRRARCYICFLWQLCWFPLQIWSLRCYHCMKAAKDGMQLLLNVDSVSLNAVMEVLAIGAVLMIQGRPLWMPW